MASEQAFVKTQETGKDTVLDAKPAFHSASPTVIDLGGIPIDLNAVSQLPNHEMIIHGKSNRPLKISISPGKDEIMVDALDTGKTTKTTSGEYHEPSIYADMNISRDGEDHRLLNLDLSTKDIATQEYHPDLRAGNLADAALNFFEQAEPLDGMRYNAHSTFQTGPHGEDLPSEILVEYRQHRRAYYEQYRAEGDSEEVAKRKSQEQAIFHSWGGRFAQRHQFTHLDKIFEEADPRSGEIRAVSAVLLKAHEQVSQEPLATAA